MVGGVYRNRLGFDPRLKFLQKKRPSLEGLRTQLTSVTRDVPFWVSRPRPSWTGTGWGRMSSLSNDDRGVPGLQVTEIFYVVGDQPLLS